jgi:hypothetical protein
VVQGAAQEDEERRAGVNVDVALREAVNLIRKGRLDGERSKADKKAEALIDGISDELAKLERKAREKAKKK